MRSAGQERETALAEFYEQWKDDGLVMLKWIALQVETFAHGLKGTSNACKIIHDVFTLCGHS